VTGAQEEGPDEGAITLSEFKGVAEEFAAFHLDGYVARLEARAAGPGRKEINDPLWGTIGLQGPEIAVLDSPLLQRLRLIRQLGVVHWVYPGALHTRFEHTLGVLRQVQYLCEAINNLGAQNGLPELINASKINLLRLAALFHDVGHAAFSHVSEHAIDTFDALSSLPAEFAREHKAESRSLSEIFAYFVARSPACRHLVGVLADQDSAYIKLNNNRGANVEEIIEKIGRAIIGRSIDDRLPLLHEIISGPFDADKLDYFVRDARAAGTPSLLDISRLIQKIAIRELAAAELPGATGRDVKASGQRHVLVGIKWSGISVLDELHLSRVLLYSKIYRHPKVIAIEQMVKVALMLLSEAAGARRVLSLVYAQNDDALIAMTAPMLVVALGIDPASVTPDDQARVEKAAAIFEDIRMRRLMSKAFQLQRTYPGDPLASDPRQKEGLVDFREIIEQPVDREEFRQKLIGEVERVVAAAGLPVRSRVELEGSIAIHPIGKTPGGTQIGRAWLIPNSGQPLEFRNYLVNRTAWADSYLSDQPAGYVFASEELADATFIAMQVLLRTEHDVRLPSSVHDSSKRDEDRLNVLKVRLAAGDYFANTPFDIRPVPERLEHADIARSIAAFAPKYELYQPPVDVDAPTIVTADHATRLWLRQFDNDDDVDCAARLLDALRMIEREDTVAAVRSFVNRHHEFRGAVVVPFGSARDSSAIHSYFAADAVGSSVSACLSLDEAMLEHGGRPILIVDDFVGSGGQGKDILAAGFGRDDLRSDLNEERTLFSTDIKNFLKSTQIGFCFTAAWDDGIELIRSTAANIGLKATVDRHIAEADIPTLATALAGVPGHQVERFLANARRIGRSLLETTLERREGEEDDAWNAKLDARALGYGNRGMLLASPFNVPTQTFTPLWSRGKADGAAWTPLLQRRKKA